MAKHSIRKSDHSLLSRVGEGWFFVFILLLTSCHSSDTFSPEEEARRDSAAFHVALMPVSDCLPFYLAQRAGIYERLGLDLRIQTLQAQLDTDTALLRRRAELVYSDLVRAIMIQQADTFDIRVVAAVPAELDLITARRGRVRSLGQLKERMVAVARHSITDYWSDRLTDSARMEQAAIFRPQINDVRIRTDMLCNGTMDAAFLPEPYASEVCLRGHSVLFSTRGLRPHLGAFLVPTWVTRDSSRLEQLRLLFQGYREAVALAAEPSGLRDSIPALLRDLCQIPDTLADSISRILPAFPLLQSPVKDDAETALRWLRSREKARKGYALDTLMFDFYGLESIQ